MTNCCGNCNSLQGNHFLFSEVDTPFVFFDINKTKKVKLREIKFKYDMPVRNYEEPFDSLATFIRQYPKFDFLFEIYIVTIDKEKMYCITSNDKNAFLKR